MRRATQTHHGARHTVHISIRALREEGDSPCPKSPCPSPDFYPRPPRGGRPENGKYPKDYLKISIHALREEGDGNGTNKNVPQQKFLSTPSARRATAERGHHKTQGRFLSTPSARRATGSGRFSIKDLEISIHALREEATLLFRQCTRPFEFLSTPSARRATQLSTPVTKKRKNFYPRPPRGGRPVTNIPRHPPTTFLSTPSARRATDFPLIPFLIAYISIHALREEGDAPFSIALKLSSYFYPRPPRGGRRTCSRLRRSRTKFLSTPSARRATA